MAEEHADLLRQRAAFRYPQCGDWHCEDFEFHWDWADPVLDPARHAAVSEEMAIIDDQSRPVQQRLDELRRRRDAESDGLPLWTALPDG